MKKGTVEKLQKALDDLSLALAELDQSFFGKKSVEKAKESLALASRSLSEEIEQPAALPAPAP